MQLRNLPPGVDDDDLRAILSRFGPLRDLGAQQRARGGRGTVVATYFDLRHARDAVKALDGAVHFGRRLEARFQCPTDIASANLSSMPVSGSSSNSNNNNSASTQGGVVANHGTLVVFNLDASTAADDVRALFSSIGDVKEIRATPNKKHHKFVEFYDVRDAERALVLLNKTEVAGKRIKIEISRPGGRAAGAARAAAASASAVPCATKSSQAQLQSSPPWRTTPRGSAPPPTAPLAVPRPPPLASSDLSLDSLATSFPPLSYSSAESRSLPRSFDRASSITPHADDDDSRRMTRFYSLSTHGSSHEPDSHDSRGRPPVSYIQALYSSPTSDDGPVTPSPGTDNSPHDAFHSASSSHEDMSSAFGDIGPERLERSKSAYATVSRSPFGMTCGNHPNHLSAGGGAGNVRYALDVEKVRKGEENRTALMIRNIPNKYNQKMLVSTLEEDHKGHFDFIYLPIDFKNKCNVGYAFINLTKVEYIESFYKAFHGKKWGRFNSEKVCEITFARIQGRQQLIAHFQNSSLLLEDPKCRPIIFDVQGRQEEFPVGSHVRTRRGPCSRDGAQRLIGGGSGCSEARGSASPAYSPPKHHVV